MFSHEYYLLSNQNKERGDLRLKFTNLKPNIWNFVCAHQIHFSH